MSLCFLVSGSAVAEIPTRTAALDNWQGLKIVHGKRCPDCCDLIFPDDYAFNNRKQFTELIRLIRNDFVQHDISCMAPPDYYALDHLVFLATERQYQLAAHFLLRPDAYGGLNLQGELAEMYTLRYQLPVLFKYGNMKALLRIDPELATDLIEDIVYDLCNEWGYDPEKIRATHDGLLHNNLPDLAREFKRVCDHSVNNNPDIQRMLNK